MLVRPSYLSDTESIIILVYKYTDVAGDSTTIRVKRETWTTLHDLRDPGQSFDDLLQELLDDGDAGE